MGGTAFGASYYVSTAGSNSNPGTLAQPFRTIQVGITAAAAGDTVFVRALTSGGAQMVYAERISFSGKNGTAAAPITLRNYPADVDGTGAAVFPAIDQTGVTPPAGFTALLTITNGSYINVMGLEFRNYQTADETVLPIGIYINGSGTGVHLIGNKVHHIYQNESTLYNGNANGFGIVVYGTNATTAVDQLVIDGNQVYSLRTGQSESLSLNGNVTNFQVTNNIVHDCNNIGIDCIGYEQKKLGAIVARNGVVRGNLVYNIDSQYNPGYGGNFAGSFATQQDRDDTRAAPGIYVDGGANITVERNHVHDCNIGMSFSSEASGKYTVGCLVRDNLIRRSHVGGLFLGGAGNNNGGTQNCSITNNTFYQNDTENYGGGSLSIQHYVTGTIIKQNIFVCGTTNTQFILKDSTDGLFAAGAIDWNLYSGTASTSLEFIWNGTSSPTYADWKTNSGMDANSRFVTSSGTVFSVTPPVNPADFTLATGSPAINVGNAAFVAASGETDYFGQPRVAGSRVDIGMNELPAGPEINVEEPVGTALTTATSTADFGTVAIPNNSVRTFRIMNSGAANLTGLTITVDGLNATEYVASALSNTPPLAPGGSATFTVTFAPVTMGARVASLHIASNDNDEPNFTVKLSGIAQAAPKITTQPLPRTVNPGVPVTFSVVATGTAPLTYQWRKHGGNISGAINASYTIAKVVEGNEDSYDVVVTNPVSSVPSNAVQLIVNNPVTFPTPPAATSADVGDSVTLKVVVAGTPGFTYQWLKNGVAILNAKADQYNIPSVKLTDSGNYTVRVTNVVGPVTSANAMLSVADTTTKIYKLPTGATATMPTLFAGGMTGYSWQKNMGALPADLRYIGGTTKTLTITGLRVLNPDDSGTYICTATVPSGDLINTAQLIVYSSPPQITLPPAVPHTIIMPTAIVGGTYPAFQIPFSSDALKTPLSFGAVGLPLGLKVDPVKGIITGKPSVSLTADKEYAITLTATNVKGTSSADASLLLKAMPYGTAGTFAGPLTRDSTLNKNLGGRFDLVVSPTGTYSGKVTLGAVVRSFVGTLEVDVNGTNKPHGSAKPVGIPALTVTFDIDSANHAIINGDVTDLTHHVAFTGWRNKWGSVMPLAESFDLRTYPGYYTFGLDIPAAQNGVETTPQGMSYGSFTIASTGALTSAGKLADGTAFTCAAFCGPHGEVLIYQLLYANLGSLLGNLDITQGTDALYVPLYGDNTLSGTVSVLRPATATRVYKTGYGPMDLTAFGGRYVAPLAPALLLGVTDDGSTNNAHLVFTQGGISGTIADPVPTQTNPNESVRIKAGALVTVPLHGATLVITQSTGFFSGSISLVDPNPAVSTANITRVLSYTGMIMRDAGVMRGYGSFLLPRRPATTTQTVLTTDLLSGQVVLEKSP